MTVKQSLELLLLTEARKDSSRIPTFECDVSDVLEQVLAGDWQHVRTDPTPSMRTLCSAHILERMRHRVHSVHYERH